MARIKSALREVAHSIPYIRRLHSQIARLKEELARWRTKYPPGHFYSPIPSPQEIRGDADRIFFTPEESLPGLDLNENEQLSLLHSFAQYYGEIPKEWAEPGRARYQFDNEYYSWADAIALYSMLRHFRPKRVIEVGSGFSSAVILDTADRYLGAEVQCTFIDPNPERLLSLLSDSDHSNVEVITRRVQEIDAAFFASLEEGDFLVIDSSHVSKTGSDLNYILFEIAPRLRKGVHVHFHDVFYPFEYPRVWIDQGVAWNEAYLLRAFLMYNDVFRIEFFTSFLIQTQRTLIETIAPSMLNSEPEPLTFADAPGASIWLKRNC